MSKIGNVLKSAHVKKNTAGTSNEISLSVLGAAKQAMDKRHGEAPRTSQLGQVNLFAPEKTTNYNVSVLNGGKTEGRVSAGDQGSAPEGASESKGGNRPRAGARVIAPPSIGLAGLFSSATSGGKKANRPKGRGVTFVVAAVLVAVVVAFSMIGLSGYSAQRAAYTSLVTQVLAVVEESDAPIVRLNDVLANPTTEESRAAFGKVASDLDAAVAALVRAEEMLAIVEERASTPSEHETAARLAKDVAGRRAMIENGKMVLYYVEIAQQSMGRLEEAWALVGKSNEALGSAARLLSTSMDADAALVLVSTSIECLNAASEKVAEAAFLFPDADLSPLQKYLEQETAAVQKEQEAIQALKSLDGALARSAHSDYESLDDQAKQALASVTDIDTLIIDAYTAVASDFITGYEAARTEVALSDGYLRDFSGRNNK